MVVSFESIELCQIYFIQTVTTTNSWNYDDEIMSVLSKNDCFDIISDAR